MHQKVKRIFAIVFAIFQIDSKKVNVANLETTVEDLKKRSGNQLDEINRLEDQLRNLNIEQTSMQSKIDTLSLNVSTYFIEQPIY